MLVPGGMSAAGDAQSLVALMNKLHGPQAAGAAPASCAARQIRAPEPHARVGSLTVVLGQGVHNTT